MALRVLVVQHAEKERLPAGPGLTKAGHAQAELTAQRLATEHTLNSIWSSPMRRAQETAGHLAAHLRSTVVIYPRLRERMNWTGREPIEDFLDDWRRASSDRTHQPRSGDSSHGAAERFLEAPDAAAAAHQEGTVAVITHGGVTTDALRTLLGDDALRAQAPQLIDEGVPSCAITTLSSWTTAGRSSPSPPPHICRRPTVTSPPDPRRWQPDAQRRGGRGLGGTASPSLVLECGALIGQERLVLACERLG